ncbi:MAG: PEGA domain-containing protein [Pseudomonadota bacterium]
MRHPLAGLLGLFVLASLGCSHTMTVTAQPPGTTIFVDDQKIGTNQGAASVPNSMGGSVKLRAEKEGYEPLEAEISKEETSMGALGGAIGGCLGGGCIGAGIGAVIASGTGGVVFLAVPCCAAVMGGPFLALLMWMNQAPDIVLVDLEKRTVTATPTVTVKVAGAEGKTGNVGTTPDGNTVTPEDQPDTTPPPGDDSVAPFDY